MPLRIMQATVTCAIWQLCRCPCHTDERQDWILQQNSTLKYFIHIFIYKTRQANKSTKNK
uniref:Uncharacterized protein n=1 Tax=Anguilla anguilla TaxID=7936 RepID=A0A0E9X3Y6_ANGAN